MHLECEVKLKGSQPGSTFCIMMNEDDASPSPLPSLSTMPTVMCALLRSSRIPLALFADPLRSPRPLLC